MIHLAVVIATIYVAVAIILAKLAFLAAVLNVVILAISSPFAAIDEIAKGGWVKGDWLVVAAITFILIIVALTPEARTGF